MDVVMPITPKSLRPQPRQLAVTEEQSCTDYISSAISIQYFSSLLYALTLEAGAEAGICIDVPGAPEPSSVSGQNLEGPAFHDFTTLFLESKNDEWISQLTFQSKFVQYFQ